MRIAMFTDSYRPQINGMVTSIEMFKKEMHRRGHEVFIFAPKVPDYKEREKNVYRIESVQFIGYKEYRIGLPFRWLLDFPIKDKKIDVVHVHSPFSVGIAGLAIARHYKIPVVGTFHTMFPDYMHYFIKYEKLQKLRFMKKLFKKGSWKYLSWFYNRCSTITVPSEKTRQILEKKGVGKSIAVVPTGVRKKSVKKSRPSLRKKYGFGKDEKIILHVGRITKEKKIDLIIDLLMPLLNRNSKYRLIIASDGPYRKKLQESVKKMQMESKIIFTGYLKERELDEFYRMSDVFVMASKTETQGLVLVEAAFSGLPIVTLKAPVISDFVAENGVGIISTQENFLDSVVKIIGDKKARNRYIKNCGMTVDKYSIKKCVDSLLEIYKSAPVIPEV